MYVNTGGYSMCYSLLVGPTTFDQQPATLTFHFRPSHTVRITLRLALWFRVLNDKRSRKRYATPWNIFKQL